jgi:HEAT repeat protein
MLNGVQVLGTTRRMTRGWPSILCALALSALAPSAPAAAQPARRDVAADAAALAGADIEAAARAAESLGANPAPAAHEALLDALAMGLPGPVAVVAFTALAKQPAPPDVAALRRYAAHRTESVRSAALGALASYPAPAAREAIAAALRDPAKAVRAAAAGAAARGRVRDAIDPLLQLLAKGEEPAARALAALADPALAAKIADQLGKVPDASLALCLGAILRRPDFGPDTARVEVVRAIAKIQDESAIRALTDYIDATPKNPPRPSRHEAELVVEARLGGKPGK